jgi:hypothetical protein
MVIVRRRSDGLYFNGTRSNGGYNKAGWTSNLQQVLPYTNERGVKAKFYHTPYGAQYQSDKARREDARRRFDTQYEMIPVRLSIG